MSLVSTIEPYRKGTSFGDWADRLAFTFEANEVADAKQKSHFMNLCGPFVYAQLKMIFTKDVLMAATYGDIINKLKQKLDKTEPDLVQRFRFSHRVQQPDESAEDFVQAVKLQAEFCGFGEFKKFTIQDRVLAGLRDENLKQLLLNEEKLTLESMDRFITTWCMAKDNAHTLKVNSFFPDYGTVSNHSPYGPPENINFIKRPVHERLGDKGYKYHQDWKTQHINKPSTSKQYTNTKQTYRYNNRNDYNNRNTNNRYNNHYNNRHNQYNNDHLDKKFKRNYTEMICDYCGIKGHLKRKCFKLKNMKREAVKFIDSTKPGSKAEKELTSLMGKMTSTDNKMDTDSEDEYNEWNPDPVWKRVNN
ncbi:tubulin-specific chaperone C-like [Malaya genurostris]|uniref:tubulin-specific chaperone C-like n=1 Tax=Malaya genurostris TaxID=325434 RepID=UPI0026F3DAEC|nr:tubulin-specific chaperone C-like [Malaya genurostris]